MNEGGTSRLVTGVDIIEIERVAAAVARHGARFVERIYTQRERIHCGTRAESLAARFAAKEAAAKALGMGIWRGGITWSDIEVVNDPTTSAPTLHLHNAARARATSLGLTDWSLSLSHDRSRALAFVVALHSL